MKNLKMGKISPIVIKQRKEISQKKNKKSILISIQNHKSNKFHLKKIFNLRHGNSPQARQTFALTS